MRANVFNLEIPFEFPRSLETIMKIGEQANEFNSLVPVFKADKSKTDQMKAEVEEESKNQEKPQEPEHEEEETIEMGEDMNEIKDEVIVPLRKAYHQIKDQPEAYKAILVTPQEFEKDDDSNFHVDFIYSLANCRANNYSLDEMDWITTKLKAGRIIPALATTTAAIAGLQALEMVKILNQTKIEDMRNAFLNLAVPSLMASEPGPPEKKKLREDLEVDVWDVWTVHFPKTAKLLDLIKKLQKKYKLEPRDIFVEGVPVFLFAVDNVVDTGKKEKTLKDALKVDEEQDHVEVTVTFANPEDAEKILEGTPPILIEFN